MGTSRTNSTRGGKRHVRLASLPTEPCPAKAANTSQRLLDVPARHEPECRCLVRHASSAGPTGRFVPIADFPGLGRLRRSVDNSPRDPRTLALAELRAQNSRMSGRTAGLMWTKNYVDVD